MPVEYKTYKPGRKIRIQVTAPTICEGQDVEPGQIINAAEDDALTLIGSHKAFALDPGPGYRQSAIPVFTKPKEDAPVPTPVPAKAPAPKT